MDRWQNLGAHAFGHDFGDRQCCISNRCRYRDCRPHAAIAEYAQLLLRRSSRRDGRAHLCHAHGHAGPIRAIASRRLAARTGSRPVHHGSHGWARDSDVHEQWHPRHQRGTSRGGGENGSRRRHPVVRRRSAAITPDRRCRDRADRLPGTCLAPVPVETLAHPGNAAGVDTACRLTPGSSCICCCAA